jgi:tetratricopeptide (TPR) repeat protein
MYFRARTESIRAQAVSDLLQEMLGSADAARGKGANYMVREMFDDFAARLGSQQTEQREVEADIRAIIGRAYRSLKLPEKAQPHFEKAIELRRYLDGPHSEEVAAVLVDGAWNLLDQQRHAEAESQVNEALAIYRDRRTMGAPLFHALEVQQHILISAKRDVDAERVTNEALEIARQSGEEFPDQANLLHRYANLKIRQGHFAEAERLAQQAVDMHYRLHGDEHPETAFGLRVLADAQLQRKKLAKAEKNVRDSLTIFRRQFPEDHPNIRDTMYQLRTILEATEDKPALAALDDEEAAIAMRSGSPEYRIQLGGLLTNPSMVAASPEDAQRLAAAAAARDEEAHRQIRQAIQTYGRVATDYPHDLDRREKAIAGFVGIIKVCIATPGFDNEIDELNRQLSVALPKLDADFPGSNECQWHAAMIYRDWALGLMPYVTYLATSEHALCQSIERLEKLSLSDPKWPAVWYYLAEVYVQLGDLYRRSAKPKDAEATFRRAMEIYDEHAAAIADSNISENWIALDYFHIAYYLACAHREDEAAQFVRQAALKVKRVDDPATDVWVLCALGISQLRLGDDAGYRETCKALVDVPTAGADGLTKVRQIGVSCLAPNALDDPSRIVERAKELVARNSLNLRHIETNALGMALYRSGNYEEAEEQFIASINANPSTPGPGFDIIINQRLFLAMTKWQRGEQDAARQLLGEIQSEIDKQLQSPGQPWIDRAALEILRREAETLIEPKEAVDAVENGKPNPSAPMTDTNN